jgi:hypothetical protein
MKKTIIASLVFIALMVGCKNETKEPKDGDASNMQTTTTAIEPSTIKFLCQSSSDPNTEADAPRHEVFLTLGSSKIKVADILNCEILNKESYEQNQIPANALAAVGGWWAGAGDYLYVIEEDGNYVVKQGATAEEMTNNDFGYKTIMAFDKNGNEVF